VMKTNVRPVADEDDDGILRKYDERGAVTHMRVPMLMRDAATRDTDRFEVRRQVKEFQRQIAADRSWVTDATGDSGIGLRRPGSRFAADSATYDETARAYQEMVANTARAWIDGPAHVVPEHTPPDTAGTAPAWHSDISFSDAEAIKAEARAAAAREQAAAWRNLRTL
jgi:hypothetical protein